MAATREPNTNPLDAFYDAIEQFDIYAESVTDQAENAGDIDEDQDIIAEIRGNLRQMAVFHKAAQLAGKGLIQRIKETPTGDAAGDEGGAT